MTDEQRCNAPHAYSVFFTMCHAISGGKKCSKSLEAFVIVVPANNAPNAFLFVRHCRTRLFTNSRDALVDNRSGKRQINQRVRARNNAIDCSRTASCRTSINIPSRALLCVAFVLGCVCHTITSLLNDTSMLVAIAVDDVAFFPAKMKIPVFSGMLIVFGN